MTKSIPLTRGKFALVDDEYFEWLNQWKWTYHKGYASRKGETRGREIYMHRIIAETPDGSFTDHIDLNKLNNQKANLRICSRSQNKCNMGLRKDNTSGYKGVRLDKNRMVWQARIVYCGKRKSLGYYKTVEEAAQVYDIYAEKYYGEFARFNFPPSLR